MNQLKIQEAISAEDLAKLQEAADQLAPILTPFLGSTVDMVLDRLRRPLPAHADCEGCFFFRPIPKNLVDGCEGSCFLEPPAVRISGGTAWSLYPKVMKCDVCRHWTPKEGT